MSVAIDVPEELAEAYLSMLSQPHPGRLTISFRGREVTGVGYQVDMQIPKKPVPVRAGGAKRILGATTE